MLPASVNSDKDFPSAPLGSFSMAFNTLYKSVNISWRVISLLGSNLLFPVPLDIPKRFAASRYPGIHTSYLAICFKPLMQTGPTNPDVKFFFSYLFALLFVTTIFRRFSP